MARGKLPKYIEVDGFRLPGGFYPQAFRDTVNYKCGDDDVFLVSYPKCGTTWMHYIIYLIYHGGEPPKTAGEIVRNTPFPECMGIESLESADRPVAIKSHLPFSLVPYSSKAKYVALTRNPKDCCVSFYHHTKDKVSMYDFADGDFNDYFELFLEGKVDYGDYFDHVLSWYEHMNDRNVLFLTYEEIKSDTSNVVLKVSKFLGRDLEGKADLVQKIVRNSDFKKMKEITRELMKTPPDLSTVTPAMKHVSKGGEESGGYDVFRKGVVGDWKNYFTVDQNQRMEEKIGQKLGSTDLVAYWQHIGAV